MKKRIYTTLILFLFALIALLGLRWADREGEFDLLAVRIDNSGPVDSALVASILEPWFGRSLLSLDTDSLLRDLESIEGLNSVSVAVSLPNTLIVTMDPGEASALITMDGATVPVTSGGMILPPAWASSSLPELTVCGEPRAFFVRQGLNLMLKRGLADSRVTVTENCIQFTENGILVLLGGEDTADDWKTWENIRVSVRPPAETVDVRYSGQAVITAGG